MVDFRLQVIQDVTGVEAIVPIINDKSVATSGLKLLFGGDICPTYRLETPISLCDASIVAPFKSLFAAQDIVVGNLECPLTKENAPIAKTGPNLKANPECAKGLKEYGFDILTVANNHIMDMGEKGLSDTLEACQTAGIMTVGAGLTWPEAIHPLVIERKGLKIGLIAIAENEFATASRSKGIGCCPLDIVLNTRMIRQLKENVDFVVLVFHGGNEYYPLPSPWLAETCRFFVEMGADIVLCHHTHVISGIEYHNGTPIVYGLGNLLFDTQQPKPVEWHRGIFVEVTLQHDQPVGLRIFPFEQGLKGVGLQPLEPKRMQELLVTIEKLSQTISQFDTLEESWQSFCHTRRLGYIVRVYGYGWFQTKLSILLSKLGLNPFPFRTERSKLQLLNFVRCESHHSVLKKVLEDS